MENINLRELALSKFQKFILTLYHLLIKDNRKFDLIVGAGSTGVVVAKLAELVYINLRIKCPPILQLPVLRYKGEEVPENLFDNSVLYPDVATWLRRQNISKLENILFVDDEIYTGFLLKESMKLIVNYKKDNYLLGEIVCTVVAEDQGVSRNFRIPEVKVDLQLFAVGIDETSNVITFFLPEELVQPIKQVLGGSIKNHWVISILLNLPIREKKGDTIKPEFTDKYLKLASEKLPNLTNLQQKALDFTNNYISQIILSS